jgi:Kef-type K+ transport system membrane component KefB
MAGGVDPLVQDIGVCLVGAGLLSVVFERLRIPHVAAFLLAGVLVGPVGLSLVTDAANIETIAHLGLTLLLFLIGLEVDVKDLAASGRVLLLSGLLQVPLSIAAGFGVFVALSASGLAAIDGWGALYLGFACAFSSTLLVVKLLQTRLRLDTVAGRISVGLLIFQDIWAIAILAVQPDLSAPELGPIARTFGGIVVVAGLAALAARYVLPGAFRLVAKMPELLVTAALAWCFGLGLLGANLGALVHLFTGFDPHISVSLEMGALLAGTSIATFPYAYDVVGKIGNLRDFFVTLFFVALGMGIPVPDSAAVLWLALVLAAVMFAVRGVVFFPLLFGGGLDRRHALEASAYLSQVSEFCLVIVFLGAGFGHVGQDVVTAITLAFVGTAVLTPAVFGTAEALDRVFGPVLDRVGLRGRGGSEAGASAHANAPRLVLLGFHRVASSLLHDLGRRHPDLLADTLVVDFNVQLHPAIRATGARVVYGDLANAETLKHVGVGDAEIVLSTVPDDLLKGTNNAAIARQVRAMNPNALVVVNAVRLADVAAMQAAGADYVFMARTETSLGLAAALDAALNGSLAEMVAAREVEFGALADRREVLD